MRTRHKTGSLTRERILRTRMRAECEHGDEVVLRKKAVGEREELCRLAYSAKAQDSAVVMVYTRTLLLTGK